MIKKFDEGGKYWVHPCEKDMGGLVCRGGTGLQNKAKAVEFEVWCDKKNVLSKERIRVFKATSEDEVKALVAATETPLPTEETTEVKKGRSWFGKGKDLVKPNPVVEMGSNLVQKGKDWFKKGPKISPETPHFLKSKFFGGKYMKV